MPKPMEMDLLRLFDIIEDIPEDPLDELKRTMKIEEKPKEIWVDMDGNEHDI